MYNISRSPEVSIACNGQDSGVIVPSSDDVVLTIDVDSGTFDGDPVDIWMRSSQASGGAAM